MRHLKYIFKVEQIKDVDQNEIFDQNEIVEQKNCHTNEIVYQNVSVDQIEVSDNLKC